MPEKLHAKELFRNSKKSRFESLVNQWKTEEDWKENSQNIALTLLDFLDENGLTQKSLAEMMGVSPQAINKWLKGQENFTLETIGKLEKVLKRKLIEVISYPSFEMASSKALIVIKGEYRKEKITESENFSEAKIISITGFEYLTRVN
ncbi:MAG: XRE family transcriptional regulator [Chitinophagaceae bacterium]|nr:MAG: XRE family transcriptional regulator [Chitinophagaceae bacterium]